MQDRKSTLRQCVFRTLATNTVLVYGYTLIIMLTQDNKGNNIPEFLSRYMRNISMLLVFSVIFAFSFPVFRLKGIPNAAKRFLHIIIIYIGTLLTYLVLSSGVTETRDRVLFIVIATLLYLVVYGLCALGASVVRRVTKKL